MPDGDAALEALTAFLARFCKILNPLFDGIRKARDMEKCLYEGRTFLWTFIVGHLARRGSRNAMDANRNEPNYADAILKLAEQSVWPAGSGRPRPARSAVATSSRGGARRSSRRRLWTSSRT